MPHRTVAFLGLLVLTGHGLHAEDRKLPDDLKDLDPNLHPELRPVPPMKDPATGFIVGGRNATSLIKGLTHINGRTIAELEEDMRPENPNVTAWRSRAGFLGPDEGLLDIMAEDNRFVVEELGLTHQALARPLLVMGIAGGSTFHPRTIRYHGKRFRVAVTIYRGSQVSPFRDKTATYKDATVENLETGKFLEYSLLVPQMIERYGFYEGKGTPYRVEPRKIVEVFDFLLPRKEVVPPDPTASDAPVPIGRPSVLWLVGVGCVGAGMAILAWLWLTWKRANAPAP